jgi:hypothetical protein
MIYESLTSQSHQILRTKTEWLRSFRASPETQICRALSKNTATLAIGNMGIKGIATMQITREAEIREKEQTGQKNNSNQNFEIKCEACVVTTMIHTICDTSVPRTCFEAQKYRKIGKIRKK